MIRLRLLGASEILTDSGEASGQLTSTKHFLLLAYLASDPGAFHRRDVLAPLLWPEVTDDRARRSLRVALSDLRKTFGDEVVVTRGDQVAVAPELVTSDLAELEAALDAGEPARAAELFRGPLLPGLEGVAPTFAGWVETRRGELRRTLITSLREAIGTAEEDHRWREAASLAAELLRVQPLDEGAFTRRVRSLRMLGHRVQALREADVFRARFEREMEMPISGELRGELAELRAVSEEAAAPRTTPADEGEPGPGVHEADAGPEEVAPEHVPPEEVAPDEALPGPVQQEEPLPPGTGWRRALLAGALGLVVVAVVGAWWLPGLTGGGEPAPHEPTPRALAWAEEGREREAAGAYGEAVGAFRAAVTADPEWGEAYYDLARAAGWGGWADAERAAVEAAMERIANMPPAVASLTRGMKAALEGDLVEARERYVAAMERDPDEHRGLLQLAELDFHWGATLGVPPAASRDPFQRIVEARPDHAEARLHLLRLDAMAGEGDAVLAGVARLADLDVAESARTEVAALRSLYDADATFDPSRHGESALVQALRITAAADAPAGTREALMERVADGSSSDRLRALALLFRSQLALQRGRLGEARAWLERVGEIAPARRDEFLAVARTLPFLTASGEELTAIRAMLERHAGDVLIGPSDRDLLAPAIYAPRRLFLTALAGGPGRATPEAATFGELVQSTWIDTAHVGQLSRILTARHAVDQRSDFDAASRALGPPGNRPDRTRPNVLAYPTAHLRWWRARAHLRSGRADEALRWYRGFPDPRGYDVAFLPGVLLARARTELQLGRQDAARSTLTRLVDLLEGSDPEYRSLLSDARLELSRLDGG